MIATVAAMPTRHLYSLQAPSRHPQGSLEPLSVCGTSSTALTGSVLGIARHVAAGNGKRSDRPSQHRPKCRPRKRRRLAQWKTHQTGESSTQFFAITIVVVFNGLRGYHIYISGHFSLQKIADDSLYRAITLQRIAATSGVSSYTTARRGTPADSFPESFYIRTLSSAR